MRGYLQYLSKWFILTKHFIQYSIQIYNVFWFSVCTELKSEFQLVDFQSLKNKSERTESSVFDCVNVWTGVVMVAGAVRTARIMLHHNFHNK